MKIIATYQGVDRHGNYMLSDVSGHMKRNHAYINGAHNNLPDIPVGARIRFFASPHWHKGEPKLSDIRELVVL